MISLTINGQKYEFPDHTKAAQVEANKNRFSVEFWNPKVPHPVGFTANIDLTEDDDE